MTMIENLIKEMRGHGCGSVLLELAHAVKRETESAKDEVARLNKELESRSQKLEDARSAMRDEHDCLRLATLEVERLKKEMATSCAAELDTNNKRHALEQQVKELEAELANQRDQVQRELDSTIDQLLGATKRVRDLEELCNSRLRYMQRTTEALTTAEKDLADLRWLVRWARQGATAPVCSSVNPPPYVGGHNTTAQAEGGAK